MVVCTGPSLTVESYEDSDTATSTGTGAGNDEDSKPVYRRRHSSFHPRRKSDGAMEDDRLLLRVRYIYSATQAQKLMRV